MKRLTTLLTFIMLSFSAFAGDDGYDLVIYGGNSSGVIAAYTAARNGLNVALIENTGHIGGLTTSGIGNIDIGWAQTVGGYTRDFLLRASKHYGKKNLCVAMECSVAEKIFHEMLSENPVKIFYNKRLLPKEGVQVQDGKIVSITMEDGSVFRAPLFIDASYEGDLMAQAGVLYVVGREPAELYGESSAGVMEYKTVRSLTPGQLDTLRFLRRRFPLDVIPGQKAPVGSSDGRSQAYVYRLCVTDRADNMVPFEKPANYMADRYLTVLHNVRRFKQTRLKHVLTLYPLPNDKYDLNHMDLLNASWGYPEGDYAYRKMIDDYHKDYQQGMLYFLANDPRLPQELRDDVRRYGLAKDEFADNGNWPYQLYIREGRRMVGEYVMRQQDAWENYTKEDAVAVGSYFLDCHLVSSILTPEGKIEDEGVFPNTPYRPYQIPYRSIIPKREQCSNLFVTSCPSASHVMFASLRMEPVYMMLGQAAATAARLSLRDTLAVQDVNVKELQCCLEKEGQIIEYNVPENMYLRQQDFDGIVLDDTNATISGYWGHSTAAGPFMKYDYIFGSANKNGTYRAVYKPFIEGKGRYEVFVMYSPGNNRCPDATIIVDDKKGSHTVKVDQTLPPSDGLWHSIGFYDFEQEKNHKVTITNIGAKGVVVADAVRFVKVDAKATASPSVVTYPMPKGEPRSDLFSVEAGGFPVDVYQLKVSPVDRKARLKGMDDKQNTHTFYEMAAFCSFDVAGRTRVKVSSPTVIKSAKILPSSAKVKTIIEGNSLSFDVMPGQKLTVEINGDEYHSLHVFANEIEKNVPDKNNPNVIYYGPGIHKVGRVVVRDNQTLYIAGGAVLMCDTSDKPEGPYQPSITLAGKNIRVCGRGIVDGSLCPNLSCNLLYVNGSDISVEGIILRDASVWTIPVQRSSNVHIDGVKILGYRANSDGIDICNSTDVLVENCFIRTLDDLVVIKTLKNGGECRNVTVRKNVLWNEVAHALSVGAEINHNISNVSFSDCDVIHDKGREWSLRVYHCDGALVSGVEFKDIRIEESQSFISLWINKAVWSSGEQRGNIDGVIFRNIKADRVVNPVVQVLGYDADHTVKNVYFSNIKVNNAPAKADMLQKNEFTSKIGEL